MLKNTIKHLLLLKCHSGIRGLLGNLPAIDGIVSAMLVSQLEVDFACVAACVPTVLRMLEEFWIFLAVRLFGIRSMGSNDSKGQSSLTPRSRGDQSGTDRIALSHLRSVDNEHRPRGPYTSLDMGDECASEGSQEHIFTKGDEASKGGIEVRADYMVHGHNSCGGHDRDAAFQKPSAGSF